MFPVVGVYCCFWVLVLMFGVCCLISCLWFVCVWCGFICFDCWRVGLGLEAVCTRVYAFFVFRISPLTLVGFVLGFVFGTCFRHGLLMVCVCMMWFYGF